MGNKRSILIPEAGGAGTAEVGEPEKRGKDPVDTEQK